MVGKWERIEQEAREDELKELERELHGEPRGGRRKPKHRLRRRQRRTGPGAPDDTTRDNHTDRHASDG